MTSPPSSLPSPALSTSSLSQPQSFSMAFQQARAPSAASITSTSTSGPLTIDHNHNRMDDTGMISGASSGVIFDLHGTPLAPSNLSFPSHYIPPMTTSPPPHAPTYVPPPQHQLPPDPIHSGGWGGNPSQWRGGPPQPSLSNNASAAFGGANPTYRMNGNVGPGPGQGPGQSGSIINGNQGDSYGASIPLSSATSVIPSPGMMPGHGRSGSLVGEGGKDRRRDRNRDEDKDEDDVIISTIFVVGFPDDMNEREFQNMFTFAPGFEAATLKFPSGTPRRETNAALFAELSQLTVAQSGQFPPGIPGSENDPSLITALEDSFSSLQMSTQTTTSSVTTPSAAMSLTPSAPSTATLGPNAQHPARRQTIGFARFKTRADALAAREALQGRKIDAVTGATLKAEMAKKNLHTKRSTGGDDVFGMLVRSGRLGQLVTQQQQQQGGIPLSAGGLSMQSSQPGIPPSFLPVNSQAAAREAWDSWPNAAAGPSSGPIPMSLQPTSSTDSASFLKDRQSMHHPPNIPSFSTPSASSAPPQQQQLQQPNSSDTPPPLNEIKSPVARPTDSKALLALAEEADELEGWNVGVVGMSGLDGFAGPTPPPDSNGSRQTQEIQPQGQGQQQPLTAQQQQGQSTMPSPLHPSLSTQSQQQQAPQAIQPQQGAFQPSSFGGGYGYTAGHFGAGGAGFGMSPPGGDERLSIIAGQNVNPADQNPPINTLYIGNLPAISPPTHPPNFLEESLRALFHRRPGFKRMSFRQKINGPMCFVEFEDIPHATLAIRDLYGNTLNGLVKGGIRLSYSKNSLGQRGNSHSQSANNGAFGGIAHTVALAGMSSPTNAPPQGNNSIGGPGIGQFSPNQAFQQSSYQSQNPSGSLPPVSASGGGAGVMMPNSSTSKSSEQRRTIEGSSLSPTAQPFNAPLPTSPRQRYFTTATAVVGGAQPTTIPKPSQTAGGSGSVLSTSNPGSSLGNASSSTAGSEYFSTSLGGAGGGATPNSNIAGSAGSSFTNPQAFSPISLSPISSPQWAPTSLGWVSSSSGLSNGVGNALVNANNGGNSGGTGIGITNGTSANGKSSAISGMSNNTGSTGMGGASSSGYGGASGPYPLVIGGGAGIGQSGVGSIAGSFSGSHPSSGVGVNGTGYGFEAFASNSLNGAASAWGSTTGSL